MKTAKPINPVIRDERNYQRKLIAFLRVTIQAPLARAVLGAQSVEQVLSANNDLSAQVLAIDALGQDVAQGEFEAIAARHTTKFKRAMSSVIPEIDFKMTDQTISAWLGKKTEQNVQLIRGMNTDQFGKFNEKINKLFVGGEFDRQAVAKAAKDSFRIGDNRAKLIGRDQVSKATGELNNIRQTEVGIERYKWRTAEDARVRPEHAANNGKIFSWGIMACMGRATRLSR